MMTQFTMMNLERAAREHNWHRLLAKSGPEGDQTILSHAKSVTGIAATLGEMIDLPGDWVSILRTAAFLHDLGKEKAEFQQSLRGGRKTKHLPSDEDIRDFLREVGQTDDKFVAQVFAVLIETHRGAGETVSAMRATMSKAVGGDPTYLVVVGEIVRLADWVASSSSPKAAHRTTRSQDFKPIAKTHGLKFQYYSLLTMRGVLSYLIHKGMQNAYRELGYRILAAYPEGCLLVGTSELDEDELRTRAAERIRTLLKGALLDRSFLESATAMQINRAMIANAGVVALDTLDELVDYAATTVKGLPGKTDEQKRAIFVRFISTMQDAVRSKVKYSRPDDEEILNRLSTAEKEVFGVDFGEIGLPMSYTTWEEKIVDASKTMEANGYAPRAIVTLEIGRGIDAMKTAYLALVEEMKSLFQATEYSFLQTMEVDDYLNTLLGDLDNPQLALNQVSEYHGNSMYHQTAERFLTTYREAKQRAMGTLNGRVRCPICGSAASGTTAIAAAVGPGTKKFLNLGIGTKRLENINICNLCILEGILRGRKGQGYILMPQVAFSAEETEVIERVSVTLLRKLDRNVFKTAQRLLSGEIGRASEMMQEQLLRICSSEKEPYSISDNVVGNYVLMTTYEDKGGSTSDNLAQTLLQAVVLHIVLDMRVEVISGLEMIDIHMKQGAVTFPGTSTLLRVIDTHSGVVCFDGVESVANELAAAILARWYAKLSDRNGILQALESHPGQLAQRIALRRESVKLTDMEIKILTILGERRGMSTLADKFVEILDDYYRPEKYGSSMHSVLGPMNALYKEFRRTNDFSQENVEAIGGKVHRQLQQLNRGDYLLTEAGAPILELCQELAKKIEHAGPRDRKRILDDLRYAVYLKRLISINARMKAKKKGGND